MPSVNNFILLVGLGNPGQEYANTPHNLGRVCVEQFMQSSPLLGKEGGGRGVLAFEKKFNALISEGTMGNRKIIAARPETFMNNSGDAVAAIANFYKIPPENIWVLHDDADIPLGNIRIAFGGSAAGHHGVESVITKLGTPNFWRFRIGIAPSEPLAIPLEAYVLKKDAIPDIQRNRIQKKVQHLLNSALEISIETAKNMAD